MTAGPDERLRRWRLALGGADDGGGKLEIGRAHV